jgi:hypothetical protein
MEDKEILVRKNLDISAWEIEERQAVDRLDRQTRD